MSGHQANHNDGTHPDGGLGRILLLGIDKAGKTSLVNTLRDPDGFKPGQRPTLGIKIVKMLLNEVYFTIYDVGGQEQFRKRWLTTIKNPEGIIYVYDLTEREGQRFKESLDGLRRLENWVVDSGTTVPLLILGNKSDLRSGTEKKDLDWMRRQFELSNSIKHREYIITSAKTGAGVREAFQWLLAEIIRLA